MSKKPTKPAKMTTRDGQPVVFPKTWGTLAHNTGPFPDAIMPVTTSSRTQAPKPPVKAVRVKRPAPYGAWRCDTDNGVPIVRTTGDMGHIEDDDPKCLRRTAAWLTHAAAYLEQEARRGK